MKRWSPLVLLLALSCAPVQAQSVGARNQFKQGRGAFSSGEWSKAQRFFEAAIKEDATYIDAHYMLGVTFLAEKDYDKAETKLRYVIGLDRSFTPAYQYLGQTLLEQKKYDEARKVYTAMLKEPGQAAAAEYCMGIVDYSERKLDSAEKHWERARLLDKEDARSRNNLGVLHAVQGHHQKALGYFSEAVRMKPENSGYLVNRIQELIELKQLDVARNELDRLLSRPSNDQQSAGYRGAALKFKLAGEWAKCLNAVERSLKEEPDNTSSLMLQGEALEHLGKKEEALKAYTEAADSDPNQAEAAAAVKRLGALVKPKGDAAGPGADSKPAPAAAGKADPKAAPTPSPSPGKPEPKATPAPPSRAETRPAPASR